MDASEALVCEIANQRDGKDAAREAGFCGRRTIGEGQRCTHPHPEAPRARQELPYRSDEPVSSRSLFDLIRARSFFHFSKWGSNHAHDLLPRHETAQPRGGESKKDGIGERDVGGRPTHRFTKESLPRHHQKSPDEECIVDERFMLVTASDQEVASPSMLTLHGRASRMWARSEPQKNEMVHRSCARGFERSRSSPGLFTL